MSAGLCCCNWLSTTTWLTAVIQTLPRIWVGDDDNNGRNMSRFPNQKEKEKKTFGILHVSR